MHPACAAAASAHSEPLDFPPTQCRSWRVLGVSDQLWLLHLQHVFPLAALAAALAPAPAPHARPADAASSDGAAPDAQPLAASGDQCFQLFSRRAKGEWAQLVCSVWHMHHLRILCALPPDQRITDTPSSCLTLLHACLALLTARYAGHPHALLPWKACRVLLPNGELVWQQPAGPTSPLQQPQQQPWQRHRARGRCRRPQHLTAEQSADWVLGRDIAPTVPQAEEESNSGGGSGSDGEESHVLPQLRLWALPRR